MMKLGGDEEQFMPEVAKNIATVEVSLFRPGTAEHERAAEPWVNPSVSYPHLAISRRFSVPYDVVLLYSDYLAGRLSPSQHGDMEARLRLYMDQNIPWNTEGWQWAVLQALRAFLKIQKEGMPK